MLTLIKSCVIPLAIVIDGLIVALPGDPNAPFGPNGLCECDRFLGPAWVLVGAAPGHRCLFCDQVFGGHVSETEPPK